MTSRGEAREPRDFSFDAVLFDFDGVLVDSEPVHFEAWREVMTDLGAELSWPLYKERCLGLGEIPMIQALAALCPGSLRFETVWAEYPRKKRLFHERMLAAPPVHRETIALIEELRLPLGLVTSNGRGEIEPILRAIGVQGRFSALVFREDVARVKPSPEPYLLAARRLGARRPLVVEDTDAGCASAEAAGFAFVRIESPSSVAALVRVALSLENRE